MDKTVGDNNGNGRKKARLLAKKGLALLGLENFNAHENIVVKIGHFIPSEKLANWEKAKSLFEQSIKLFPISDAYFGLAAVIIWKEEKNFNSLNAIIRKGLECSKNAEDEEIDFDKSIEWIISTHVAVLSWGCLITKSSLEEAGDAETLRKNILVVIKVIEEICVTLVDFGLYKSDSDILRVVRLQKLLQTGIEMSEKNACELNDSHYSDLELMELGELVKNEIEKIRSYIHDVQFSVVERVEREKASKQHQKGIFGVISKIFND